MSTTTKIAGAAFSAAALMTFAAGPAFADGSASGTLRPVPGNGVNASGTASVKVTGNTVSITVAATGLLANQPHAGHIHFSPNVRHTCPTLADDTNKDGHLNTTEGQPAYGDINVSFTTSGDTSKASGLAVDRFPTAPGGKYTYQRANIPVSSELAAAITKGQTVVVLHGVDYNKDGKYDGNTKSDLDPSLPTEATDPAVCGVLSAAPSGGMATGEGGASGDSNAALLAIGASALLGAAGTGIAAKRRRRVEV